MSDFTTWLDETEDTRPATTGCGTTGCEAHDGECRDNWGEF